MAVTQSVALRNAQAQQVQVAVDAGPAAGTIQLRTGTKPATVATAVTGTLLATVTLADPSAPAAANGVLTFVDPAAVTGVAAGDVGYARFLDSTGAAVLDCTVTATGGGGDITMSTVTVSVGLTVDMGVITYTAPA